MPPVDSDSKEQKATLASAGGSGAPPVVPAGLPPAPCSDPHAVTVAQTPLSVVDATPPGLQHEPMARYEALEVLGEGGMGEVRLCKDVLIGRQVARKAIKPGHGSRSDLRRRFLREARVQGQLEHPAIVPVYDLSLGPDPAFFTMKRVRGVTLEAVIERLARGDSETAAVHTRHKLLTAFNSVCLAVEFAHAHGVVHRDLKPANVMLGDFGEVYVLDWGVAKVIDDPDVAPAEPIEMASMDAKTEAGAVMGTLGYMSPEQVRGGPVDVRSDVYSLGAMLFEILALAPLHLGPTASELMASTLRSVDARLSADKAVPPELEAICIKATELDPRDRFASARDVHDAIERFLDGDRDVELRRSLARGHAKAASVAKEQALMATGEAQVAALHVAFGEVGRALALDPTNEDAIRVTLELRVLAPRKLPEEARAELGVARERTFGEAARAGALALLSTFIYLPVVLWMGVRDVRPFLALYGLALVAAAVSYIAIGRQSNALSYVVAFLAVCAFGALSRVLGPFMLVPCALITMVAGFAIDPQRSRSWFALVCCCLAMIVPWTLEQAGVIERSYVFGHGTITIMPHAVAFPEGPTTLLLLLVSVGTLVTCSLLVGRMRAALEWAEHRVHMKTWQLRQLVPDVAESLVRSSSRKSSDRSKA